jgi:hypothetical protein
MQYFRKLEVTVGDWPLGPSLASLSRNGRGMSACAVCMGCRQLGKCRKGQALAEVYVSVILLLPAARV